MSDTPDDTQEDGNAVVIPKTLDQSRLYILARSTPLLSFLLADMPTQIAVEVDIDEQFPRVEDDGDDTRILINYRNNRGNSKLSKLLDSDRLERTFDIDHFLDGFLQALQPTNLPEDPIQQAESILMAAMQMAITTVLGFNQEGQSEKTKSLSSQVLQSVVAIIFDDPLDVIVALNDPAADDNNEVGDPIVVGMWVVKTRPQVEPTE